MTERILRPARDISTISSFSRESQDTEYVVDIPLSDFRGRTPEPDESEETGLIDSHHLRIAQEQDQQQQRQYFQIGSQYDDRESVRDGAFLSCNSEAEVASFLPEEVKEEDDDESKDFGMWLVRGFGGNRKVSFLLSWTRKNFVCYSSFHWLMHLLFLLLLADNTLSYLLCTRCQIVRRWYFNDIESGPSSTSRQLELLEEYAE
jgi:hypothetical protein